MLSEAVVAHFEKLAKAPSTHGFSWTSISPCAYATYIHFHKLDPSVNDGVDMLRMNDGHYQEQEMLDHIHAAGFKTKYTGRSQLRVTIEKSGVRGSPDGIIRVDERDDLLEIKAMSSIRFTGLSQEGLDKAEPGIKCQVQGYMASEELKGTVDRCHIYYKHKDTCRPDDICEGADPSYISPIIEATDSIVLDRFEPKKELIDLCVGCRHNFYCWGGKVLDLSKMKTIPMEDMVAQWLEGEVRIASGELLVEEARAYFYKKLGEGKLLICEGADVNLRYTRIFQHRKNFDINAFIELFGAERLPEVLKEKVVEQFRVTKVG